MANPLIANYQDVDFSKYTYLLEPQTRVFFVGIGGISMSGLAELAQDRGLVVGGSDRARGARVADLERRGIQVYCPQRAENIEDFRAEALVYSAAISQDNPELVKARELGLPCLERSVWLGLVNRSYPQVINVAGTNGKSTTTAMCSYILLDAGMDPTIHLGAELDRLNSTVHTGRGELMLSEACEFNLSFYAFYSTITAILNLGHDHVDIFPNMEDVLEAFAGYILRQAPATKLVLPSFDPHIPALLDLVDRQRPGFLEQLEIYYYGYATDKVQADLAISKLRYEAGLPLFNLTYQGQDLGTFRLSIPGRFNVENAAAALLLCHLAGADFDLAKQSLQAFKGAEGRFTLAGHYQGALIVNDYAHHPDSLKLTLEAAAEIPHRRIFACFQPITYSRAKGLFPEFVEALKDQAHPILLEVFDDREKDRSFSSAHIAEAINAQGGSALFFAQLDDLEAYLRQELKEGDLALLMGQNIRQVGDRLAERQDHFHQHQGLAEQQSTKA
ncbi:MAG: Mur ligase domain-containing protein [Eubacteriales bacterium]|nr:Mur ligase domain-containing protein [Eubacteriales bacterium]